MDTRNDTAVPLKVKQDFSHIEIQRYRTFHHSDPHVYAQWDIKQHIPWLNKAHRQAQKPINNFELRIEKKYMKSCKKSTKTTGAQYYTKISTSATDLDADLHNYTIQKVPAA